MFKLITTIIILIIIIIIIIINSSISKIVDFAKRIMVSGEIIV